VTNQPDVARGTTSREAVEEINKHLALHLVIDEFYSCFHDSDDNCDCRKPKPGSLLAAAKKHSIDLGASYMVGDRWRDIEAGKQAGCKTIFIDYGYTEKQPGSFDYRVGSLLEASKIILGDKK
jgi:D-glycero-D-manno-heptose 1,7-bisphosphate phosphatase